MNALSNYGVEKSWDEINDLLNKYMDYHALGTVIREKPAANVLLPFIWSTKLHTVVQCACWQTEAICSWATAVYAPIHCPGQILYVMRKGFITETQLNAFTINSKLIVANSNRALQLLRSGVLDPKNVGVLLINRKSYNKETLAELFKLLPKTCRCIMFASDTKFKTDTTYHIFQKLHPRYEITVDPLRQAFAGTHYILVETHEEDRVKAIAQIYKLRPNKNYWILASSSKCDLLKLNLSQEGIPVNQIPIRGNDHPGIEVSSDQLWRSPDTIVINHSLKMNSPIFLSRSSDTSFKVIISLISFSTQKQYVEYLESQLQVKFPRLSFQELDELPQLLASPPVIPCWDMFRVDLVGVLWSHIRVLWIGWMKNLYPECLLASLPKEILKYIIHISQM